MEDKLVLIVDDDADNRELIRAVVGTLAGARTEQAASGAEALGLVRQHHPDLILLDAYLPDLLGCEVVGQLRANPATSAIPIVAVSAHCADTTCPADLVACDACLPKPFEIDRLIEMVQRFLGG